MRTLLIFVLLGCAVLARADAFAERKTAYLQGYLQRPLKQGANPGTWVDDERWCVAHACLEAGVRLEEANRYFSEVAFVSLWHGLVADTDVQMTDLLWTYLRFRDSDRLSPAAKAHLRAMFAAWQTPNQDRNRQADTAYAWPAEYTENHSLNILAAAYLCDIILERDRGLRVSLLKSFFTDRARWGWSEFHSPSYGLVTAKVLGLLAATAPDRAIADAARMHLDLLAIEYALTSLSPWRGIPYARGYGAEVNNAANSMVEVAKLWFGEAKPTYTGSPMLLHLLTNGYRPPTLAEQILSKLRPTARYLLRKTATHGPGKQRVPIVCWVSPSVTMASAQGAGSYYDGSYCSISFASAPNRVIIARDGKRRNIIQWQQTLLTFGQVAWHGDLGKQQEDNLAIGGDERAWAGQLTLAPDCHLLMVEEKTTYPTREAFRAAMLALQARFSEGTATWTMPDGTVIKVANERDGNRWRAAGLWVNETPYMLDSNLLVDCPTLRSVRDSRLFTAVYGGRIVEYDFRDMDRPQVRERTGDALPALPPATVTGPLGIVFRYIPPGEFPLGSPLTEGRANERPQRWVTLDGFYLAETEVTVGQYKQFLAQHPELAPPDWYYREWGKTDAHAMTWVSWEEADAFCRWLSAQAGRTVRLPREAEWEKAARGYTYRAYPWGDDYDGTQSGTPNGEYAPAGAHPLDVSLFGVRGMAGNAWEWCADWYAADAYATPAATHPAGPAQGTTRVLRGCGWNFDPDTFRCSYRTALSPGERSLHIGFRVVLVPDER